MARSRFWCLTILSLATAVALADTGHSQQPIPISPASPKTSPADVAGAASKIYSLADLGDDPKLGNWVADTILAVIEPDSWTHDGNYQPIKGTDQKVRRTLSYFAPSKVMVVYHTPAVHAKVDEFLKDLKKATATSTAKAKKPATVDPAVQQAQFVPAPVPTPPGYPVAGPLQQPKHLFHFIIRYEGEGVLDANVVEFAKALQSATKNDGDGGGLAAAAQGLAIAGMLNQIPGKVRVEPSEAPIVVDFGPGATTATPPTAQPLFVPVQPRKMPPAESEKKTPIAQ